MRVYLAAPYGSRDLVRDYASSLPDYGMTCTSSWLEEVHEINAGTQGAATALPDKQVADHARQDIADLDESDAVVLFTAAYVGVEGGGGRHVETGYALGRSIPIVVVGEPENVFHRMGGYVYTVDNWDEAVAVLAAIA